MTAKKKLVVLSGAGISAESGIAEKEIIHIHPQPRVWHSVHHGYIYYPSPANLIPASYGAAHLQG